MYTNRRKQLSKQLPSNSIALLFSEKAPYKIGDEKYAFSVDRNFYYFTGLDKENMIVALVKDGEQVLEYLFIERYDEEMAKWVGGKMLPEEAQKVSNIANVYWIDEAKETIGSILSRRFDALDQVKVFVDCSKQEYAQTSSDAQKFALELAQTYPQVQCCNLASKCSELRLIKEDYEIQELQSAIQVTKKAIENVMSHAQAGMSENELEAYFDFVLKTNNCLHSFPSIVAGGKNATILHYEENNQKVKDRSLVLLDLGAAQNYYNADISRTFPINGTFTKRQREIYDIVLRANKYIISLVKPGVTLRGLNNELIKFYEKELGEIGLLKHGKTVCDYYWHGVSHMLGLETHDVSLPNYELRPGNVFTVEPGLYLEDEKIGIRIEDNVLVTEDGCINLSADIIKEVDDIEAFMKK